MMAYCWIFCNVFENYCDKLKNAREYKNWKRLQKEILMESILNGSMIFLQFSIR